MSDPFRTARPWAPDPAARLSAVFGLLMSVAAGACSVGCSLAVNLDDLDNALGQGADAASGDSVREPLPAAIDGGQLPDSTVAAADGADAQMREPDGAFPPATMGEGGVDAQEQATDAADSSNAQDGATDRGGADAGLGPLDAGTDATGSTDAAPAGTWCSTHKSSSTADCHDFDEGQPVQYGFTNHYYSGDFASVTSTDFAPGSPPSALLVSTPLLDAGGPSQDEQFNDVLSFHDKVELSFALKLVNYDASAPYVSLFRFSYQDGAWAAQFDLRQGGAVFNETTALPDGGTSHSTYAAAQPSPLDAWTNVDCLFDFAKHTVSLSFNGVVIVSNQPITNPDQSAPTLFVQAGLNFLVSPAKPMMIYYDNILLNTPP
jgi:hypothetical protein